MAITHSPETGPGQRDVHQASDADTVSIDIVTSPPQKTQIHPNKPSKGDSIMLCRGLIIILIIIATSAPTMGAGKIALDGELLEIGFPANGVFDFRFRCHSGPDAAVDPEIGVVVEQNDVRVVNGQFSVELDFKDDACLDSGWIRTSVARGDRIAGFTALEPLQPVPTQNKRGSKDIAPSNAVVFFALAQCPPGWSEYIEARGRAVVGLQSGGTLEGTLGTPLSNLGQPLHQHTFTASGTTSNAGVHRHAWSSIQTAGSDIQWSSYDASGSPVLAFAWQNGIGSEGSGIYPLAASPNATYYTDNGGSHQHFFDTDSGNTELAADNFPYIQLLACRKN